MPSHPPVARVLFDESHSESWTVRPDVARSMQPSHPADSSYVRAADALRERSLAVEAVPDGPLGPELLGEAAVLVIAHPSEPKWERTVPGSGSPRLSPAELDAVEAFVHSGGGLVLLAEEEQDKYGNNVAELAARFGVRVNSDLVSDYDRHHAGTPHWLLADLPPSGMLARVGGACFYRATTLGAPDGAQVLARAGEGSSAPGAALLACVEHGRGRVVVVADSDLFGDDCLDEHGHRDLWVNLVHWAAQPSLAQPLPHPASAAQRDPAWALLKTETDALRLMQDPDGSVDLSRHDPARHVEAMCSAVERLARRFPHQREYLAAVVDDLG